MPSREQLQRDAAARGIAHAFAHTRRTHTDTHIHTRSDAHTGAATGTNKARQRPSPRR